MFIVMAPVTSAVTTAPVTTLRAARAPAASMADAEGTAPVTTSHAAREPAASTADVEGGTRRGWPQGPSVRTMAGRGVASARGRDPATGEVEGATTPAGRS